MTKIKLPLWAAAWILTLIVCGGVIAYGYMTPSPAKITQSLKLSLTPKQEHTAKDASPTAAPSNPPSKKYASPAKGTTDDARISILLVNLGVDHATDTLAMQLPPEVSFAYRPTPTDLPQHIENHKREGREILLMIPMEPNGYPHNDPGPDALLTSLPVEENLKRLAHHLEKAEGVIGVGPFMGDAFTRNVESSEPVASWLSKHGYAVFDMTSAQRRSNFINETMEYGGTYIDNPVLLDDFMADDRFREVKFDYLETVAKREGQSVGIVTVTPKAVEQLQAWIKTFPDKKLVLTPVSTVYLYKSTRFESAEKTSNQKVDEILTDDNGQPLEAQGASPHADIQKKTTPLSESPQKVMTHEPTASTQNIKTTPLTPGTDQKATTGDVQSTTGNTKAAPLTPAPEAKATTDAKPAEDAKATTDAKPAEDAKATTSDAKPAQEQKPTTPPDTGSGTPDSKPTVDAKAVTSETKPTVDAKAVTSETKPTVDAKAVTSETKPAVDAKAATPDAKPAAEAPPAVTDSKTDTKATAPETNLDPTKTVTPDAKPTAETKPNPTKPVAPQAPEAPTKPVADTLSPKTETPPKPLSESPKS